MFITRRSLPRRTFLPGMGVTMALPLLDAMVPAMTAQSRTAAAPVRRFGAVYVPHGKILQPVDAGDAGRRLRVHADPQAAGALPRSPVRRQRPRRPEGSGGGRPRHGAGDVAHRHLTQEDRRRRRPQRDDHRPDDRQGDRPGHAVPVARTGHRGLHRLRRRLRRRLQLHLHEHHLLAGTDDAAAHGDQPARRVRAACSAAPVRSRSGSSACGRAAASSIRCRDRRRGCSRGSAPATGRG